MVRPRVLVVDDEPEILATIRRDLELEGIGVHTSSDASQALELLREHAHDVVVCDIMMPGFSGVELLRCIKAEHPLCQVMMMTGHSTLSRVVECFEAGTADYFPKPLVDTEKLYASVRIALEKADRWRLGMVMARRR
ncbi:MAG: response regulator [Candidatus Schekmanbacteria bacterium]|nr:response regulator [Candidatus Schekmanbacteria bacterium]